MPVRCVFIGDRLKGQRGMGAAATTTGPGQGALERCSERAEPRITSSFCLRATQVMAHSGLCLTKWNYSYRID